MFLELFARTDTFDHQFLRVRQPKIELDALPFLYQLMVIARGSLFSVSAFYFGVPVDYR